MIDRRVEFGYRRQAEKRREIQFILGLYAAKEDCDEIQFVLNRQFFHRSGVFPDLKFVQRSKVDRQPGVRSIVNSVGVGLLRENERFADRNQLVHTTQPGVKVDFHGTFGGIAKRPPLPAQN